MAKPKACHRRTVTASPTLLYGNSIGVFWEFREIEVIGIVERVIWVTKVSRRSTVTASSAFCYGLTESETHLPILYTASKHNKPEINILFPVITLVCDFNPSSSITLKSGKELVSQVHPETLCPNFAETLYVPRKEWPDGHKLTVLATRLIF